jgi:hypothetical protein
VSDGVQTLTNILDDVAQYLQISRKELVEQLFGSE